MVRHGVEAMGLSNDIENYDKFPELPSVGWEGEVADTEHGPRDRVHYCPFVAVWQKLGSEEMGRIKCAQAP
jgi:hypothetical protein